MHNEVESDENENENNEMSSESANINKKKLEMLYERVELPDFPEHMEDMLVNEVKFWDDRNKRHQFIQYLASYYFYQTTFTFDEKVIGYIYQPVCQKLLEHYENLRAILNQDCIKINSKIIKGEMGKRKRIYQPWV